MKKILFVCKYNRFRSRTAEAAFNKLNSNKEWIAESAGIFQGPYPLDPSQVNEAKKLGLEIEGKPRSMSTDLLKTMDKLVIVADNVPDHLFKGWVNEIITWPIPDSINNIPEEDSQVITSIIKKVEELLEK